MSRKVNQKRAGRPKGRKTKYAGIMAFCARNGYSHQHVREVLEGGRRSPRVRRLWAQWQKNATA